jgi:arsenate reductase (glutaredoxin)
MIEIFGIKQCSTMKKAFDWMDEHHVDYVFHDYKKEGVSRETLQSWVAQVGWESLVNTRGTTWRKLDEESRQDLDEQKAIALMLGHNSLIKRPVITGAENLILGFDDSRYARELGISK